MKKTMWTLAALLILATGISHADGEKKKSPKGKQPAQTTTTGTRAKTPTGAKAGARTPRTPKGANSRSTTGGVTGQPRVKALGANPSRSEQRFRRGLATRSPESTGALKTGVNTRTNHQNNKARANGARVKRTTGSTRETLRQNGDTSRMRNRRGQVRDAMGRAGSPTATKAGMASGSGANTRTRTPGATTRRGQAAKGTTSRSAAPGGTAPVATPKGAKPKTPATKPKSKNKKQ